MIKLIEQPTFTFCFVHPLFQLPFFLNPPKHHLRSNKLTTIGIIRVRAGRVKWHEGDAAYQSVAPISTNAIPLLMDRAISFLS